MKKVLVAAAALFVLASLPAFAQEPVQPAPQKQEDVEKVPAKKADPNESAEELRKQFETLGKVVGIEVAPVVKTPAENEKTMADVADRALDMTENMVGQLSETFQRIAPDVWRIMYKQQYAKAFSMLIPPLVWLVVCLSVNLFGTQLWITQGRLDQLEKDGSKDDHLFYWAIRLFGFQIAPGAIAVATALFNASSAGEVVRLLVNPEYYAIRDLLQMILSGGRIS
jgi:hypothetical protein